jgi:hypothetical protein
VIPADDEAIVAALSEEARRVAAAGAPEQPPLGAWRRLEERRRAQQRRASRRWIAAGGLAAAAVLVVAGRGWRDRAAVRPLTYEVAGGDVDDAGYVRAEADHAARLAFSDGTRVKLAPGAKVSVAPPGAHGARVRVQDGSAHFEVMHLPQAAWTVDAGPYSVEVTGTVFDVRWSGAEEVAEVHLRAGSVRVSGPLLTEHATLRPGQTLIARLAAHELRIDQAGPAAAPGGAPAGRPRTPPRADLPAGSAGPAAPAPTTGAAPAAADSPAPRPAAAAAPPKPRRRRPRLALAQTPPPPAPAWTPEDWPSRVAAGDAKAILAEAEAHDLDAVLNQADAPALGALADAARYTARPDLAARVLLAERRRFSGTPAAAGAAFFLGRLADDGGEPTAALDWYRRYLNEQPRGLYASEALGRAMLAVARVSGRAAAREMAQEYLDRFPNGTYLLHARQILAAP